MKRLCTFSYTFLICAFIVKSQEIPNHSKTIIVKGVSFLQICNALLDSGYTINKKDNELQTAITDPKEYPKYWNAKYIISIRVKDSIAYFTGKSLNALLSEDLEYITNKKGKPLTKALFTYPFLIMNQFAKGFNKEIEYK